MKAHIFNKVDNCLLHLSTLLDYPDANFLKALAQVKEEVSLRYPDTAPALRSFESLCAKFSPCKLEEIFTRTFDLAAICSPYITGYIYGNESYDRGTLMAQLSEKLEEYGIEREGELPDHLKLLLRLGAYSNEEELKELCTFCLLEPVKAMKGSLPDTNPYFHLIGAIQILVERGASGKLRGHLDV